MEIESAMSNGLDPVFDAKGKRTSLIERGDSRVCEQDCTVLNPEKR